MEIEKNLYDAVIVGGDRQDCQQRFILPAQNIVC